MPATRKPNRWVVVLWLAALVLILYLRLIPFVFVWHSRIPVERIQWQPLMLLDVPFNILIFAPFGFGLAGLLARGDAARAAGPALGRRVVLAGVLLSALLEATQVFMPDRAPSLADIAANGIGVLLGYGLFRAWEMGIARALQRTVTRRNLLLVPALYALGVALLTAFLYRGVHLDNWDTSFPLIVGNEATGDRLWRGWMGSLTMEAGNSDHRAFFADYALEGDVPYEATARKGFAPPLVWQAGPATPQDGRGIITGTDQWLMTTESFSDFSEVARQTDRFAIHMEIATANPQQRQDRRLVSVSPDVYNRNVSVIQNGDALVVRLRTLANGKNGHRPEASVPGVFTDTQPRRITVAYSAPMLRVTVDGQLFALSLGPGMVFFSDIKQGNYWLAPMTGNPYRFDIYYGLIMVVPAVALAGFLLAAKRFTGRRA